MSDLHIEIACRLERGENPKFIAKQLNIPLEWVLYVQNSLVYEF